MMDSILLSAIIYTLCKYGMYACMYTYASVYMSFICAIYTYIDGCLNVPRFSICFLCTLQNITRSPNDTETRVIFFFGPFLII